ncbi:hypothetical protein FIS3754_42610 [Fischerella sp. NIES-3754]|nr:hypothetical protein FIS3754_42610 [Fischerella sp. NIES-3754]BCX10684.1 MAG: hypothetical protein KatS3mg066_4543 [Fischerella sp.]
MLRCVRHFDNFFVNNHLKIRAQYTPLQNSASNQVCIENSAGAIPQFAQVIASCADCTFGGTRNT